MWLVGVEGSIALAEIEVKAVLQASITP